MLRRGCPYLWQLNCLHVGPYTGLPTRLDWIDSRTTKAQALHIEREGDFSVGILWMYIEIVALFLFASHKKHPAADISCEIHWKEEWAKHGHGALQTLILSVNYIIGIRFFSWSCRSFLFEAVEDVPYSRQTWCFGDSWHHQLTQKFLPCVSQKISAPRKSTYLYCTLIASCKIHIVLWMIVFLGGLL